MEPCDPDGPAGVIRPQTPTLPLAPYTVAIWYQSTQAPTW